MILRIFYIIIQCGDRMNYLEINKIFNKMIDNTRNVVIDLEIARLKSGLLIDKNNQ